MKYDANKIQTGLSVVTMFFVAFIWWGDNNSKTASENSSQTEQLRYLAAQVQDVKEGLKDLNKKVDALSGIKYSWFKKEVKNVYT